MKYKYSRKKIAEIAKTEVTLTAKIMSNAFIKILLEPAEWPRKREKYWFVGENGEANWRIWYENHSLKSQKAFGNCFKTEKEAIKARNKIKRLLKK